MINHNNNIANDDLILECEVENSINILKDGKSPGNAKIQDEMITYRGKRIAKIYMLSPENKKNSSRQVIYLLN